MCQHLRFSSAAARLLIIATLLIAPAVHAQAPTVPPAGVTTAASSPPLRFFALGDLPYSESEVVPLQALLAAAAVQHPPFIAHVGDIKSGGSRCGDEQLRAIAALFRAVPVPLVFTPGDNEWTDCHRLTAGGLDPRLRLARVREVFYDDPTVLRLDALGLTRAGPRFPEIYGFVVDRVLFLALHIVGSDNGRDLHDPAAMAEFTAREEANQAFLTRMLASAPGREARALVLMMQADPLFEREPGQQGFRGLKDRLIALMGQFRGPVLLIHGDTHRYRQDHPLLDPVRGTAFERFTRVEVPGAPIVGGVWITVDPQAPEPFHAQPVYATSLDSMGSQ
ncbi:hypothetical protein [uncultured Thiodictyon sp.]|uniref:hypothetical protein n=1 Tax=uncultured Thiodictyon sp. TaxID=1846217 RepID=UPI0025D8F687|nr:hypothetical protein [uncultured Thiodictyon sp.]